MKEFRAREDCPNRGGTQGSVMTSYRQDALRCLRHLAAVENARGCEVARGSGVPRATRIMAANHYGWFVRVRRGVYAVSEAGRVLAGP